MLTGWINFRDYGGSYWEILAPQGVRPMGSYFLAIKEFTSLEEAYQDIRRQGGRIYILATQEGSYEPFELDAQISMEQNIMHLRNLLQRD